MGAMGNQHHANRHRYRRGKDQSLASMGSERGQKRDQYPAIHKTGHERRPHQNGKQKSEMDRRKTNGLPKQNQVEHHGKRVGKRSSHGSLSPLVGKPRTGRLHNERSGYGGTETRMGKHQQTHRPGEKMAW